MRTRPGRWFGSGAAVRACVAGAVVCAAILVGAPGEARSQEAPSVTMNMLLERTIFRIDVLTLVLRVEGEAARSLQALVTDRERTAAAADSAAALVIDANQAYARLDFLRSFSMELFLGGIRDNADDALAAGVIDRVTRDFLVESLPGWYSFLEGRGVREGDRMEYFIRGDTLTVHYRSDGGTLLMDQTDVGPLRRRSVLAGWVAPGTDFREGLMESLFGGAAR